MCDSASDNNWREVFLNTNIKEERVLNTTLNKIERERKRKAAHTLQKQREFLLNVRSKPDPMLIVERPPTYDALYTGGSNTNDLFNISISWEFILKW